MTVKERLQVSLTERYQVFVDFTDGGNGVLINSYSRPETAERCVRTLNDPDNPDGFISRAWTVDVGSVMDDMKAAARLITARDDEDGGWVDTLVSNA